MYACVSNVIDFVRILPNSKVGMTTSLVLMVFLVNAVFVKKKGKETKKLPSGMHSVYVFEHDMSVSL